MTLHPPSGRYQQAEAHSEQPAGDRDRNAELKHSEPCGRGVHLEPADQPGDSTHDSPGKHADRRESLNRWLGGYVRQDLFHVAESRGFSNR